MPTISEAAMTGGRVKGSKKAVLKRLAKYFLRYKWRVLAAFLLMIGSNLFALLGPYLTGLAIDAIALEGGPDFGAVAVYCALMAGFYVLSSVFSYVLSVLMIKLSQAIVKSMRQDVFDKILRLPVSLADRLQTGDVINRIQYDIDTVNASLSYDILQAATSVITVVGAFIGMAAASPAMLGVLLITVPIALIIAAVRSRKVRPLFRKRSAKLAALNGFSEEMLSGIKTIKAYGREQPIENKFRQKNTDAADAYYDADYFGSLIGPAVNFVNNLGTVLISTAGAFLYLYGLVSLGNISSFLLYSRRFSGPINEYANIMGEIQSALAAAERVFRLMDAPEEPKDAEGAKELTGVRGETEFENVCFSYDGEKEVIKNLSFKVLPGQTAAIVGPTGAGKTTLVNLMMRFYDPGSGRILLDGEPIDRYTRKSLRAAFTMVLQDTWLFEGTVYDNIAYGKEGAAREEVEAAAREAHVYDFVSKLPAGLYTPVTDGGVNLSKGQRQLITIARAMLSPAGMLILDEATSNVDTRTELLIRDAMAKLMRGRTCFIIAHRLSTIVNADLILVVKEGDVIESGTHKQLLENEGFYKEIYSAQFE